MNGHEETRYDIIRQSTQGGEAERRKAALLQTRSLLSVWRGRFSTNEVSRTYPCDEGQAHIRSSSNAHVRVSVEQGGDTLTYDFDAARETPLEVTETVEGVEQEVGGDVVSHHYNLAELLYGFDRAEARG